MNIKQSPISLSWTSLWINFFLRDIDRFIKNPARFLTSLFFFLSIVGLMPFVMNADTSLLRQAAAGIVWLAGILSALLSLETLFKDEAEHGFLDLITGLGLPMELFFLVKAASHWLTCLLPLILLSPIGGLLAGLSFPEILTMMCGFAVGSPAISLLGAMGACFGLGSKSSALLIPLLILPLLVPTLIFGVALAKMTWLSDGFYNMVLVLTGLNLLFTVLSSLVSAVILRLVVRQG